MIRAVSDYFFWLTFKRIWLKTELKNCWWKGKDARIRHLPLFSQFRKESKLMSSLIETRNIIKMCKVKKKKKRLNLEKMFSYWEKNKGYWMYSWYRQHVHLLVQWTSDILDFILTVRCCCQTLIAAYYPLYTTWRRTSLKLTYLKNSHDWKSTQKGQQK